MTDYTTLKKNALDKYFSHLNPEQRDAVFTVKGSVLILAGAGSGKTTVLVNRIANMIMFGNAYADEEEISLTADERAFLESYDGSHDKNAVDTLRDIISIDTVKPWSILAITFTNKAANELKSRLALMLGDDVGKEVRASTFHSACVRILRREIAALGYSPSFTIYDADDSKRLLKSIMDDLSLPGKSFPPNMVSSAISRAKDELQTPEEYADEAEGDYRNEKIAQIYTEYQKRLRAANALDFDDIIMKTVQLFEDFPDVLEHYRNLYKYILVDEYQDTNHAQYRLVSLLADKYKNLCVVGDDDQSIYRFRGATVENILSFEDQFEKCKVIRLEQNYRSYQNILSGANSVIANNSSRHPKELWSDRGDGEKIEIWRNDTESDEALFVTEKISELVEQGHKYSDFVVLYRINALSNAFEKKFSAARIPYRMIGGLRFYDRKEVKDILAYMTMLVNPFDNMRFSRIINEPRRNIGNVTVQKINEISVNLGIDPLTVMRESSSYAPLAKKANVLQKTAEMFDYLTEKMDELDPAELIDEILRVTGYGEMLENSGDEGIERLENINELKSNIAEYIANAEDNGDEADLNGFLENAALYTDMDRTDMDTETVSLMTVHTAKGLEFPIVFVVGMEDGIFPSGRATYSDLEVEEERRLAYVAMTRAKDKLYLSYSSQRMLYGQSSYNPRSRFLKEIDEDCIETFPKITVSSSAEKRSVQPAAGASSKSTYLSDERKKKAGAVQKGRVDFTAGDSVIHPKFGKGLVLSAKPMGGDNLLEIAFETVGTKKVMAANARMEKAE